MKMGKIFFLTVMLTVPQRYLTESILKLTDTNTQETSPDTRPVTQRWTIQAPENRVVIAAFKFIRLNVSTDHLKLYSSATNENGQFYDFYQKENFSVASSINTMTIDFHIETNTSEGFSVDFRSIAKDTTTFSTLKGSIHSPLYPQQYPCNFNSTYVINNKNNSVIHLRLPDNPITDGRLEVSECDTNGMCEKGDIFQKKEFLGYKPTLKIDFSTNANCTPSRFHLMFKVERLQRVGADGGHSGEQPEKNIGAALLIGLVGLLIVVILAIGLFCLYIRKQQSEQNDATKEEEKAFIAAEAENRKSDIALQLLQVTDPSYIEAETTANDSSTVVNESITGNGTLSMRKKAITNTDITVINKAQRTSKGNKKQSINSTTLLNKTLESNETTENDDANDKSFENKKSSMIMESNTEDMSSKEGRPKCENNQHQETSVVDSVNENNDSGEDQQRASNELNDETLKQMKYVDSDVPLSEK